jgi:hypothetical protein
MPDVVSVTAARPRLLSECGTHGMRLCGLLRPARFFLKCVTGVNYLKCRLGESIPKLGISEQ